MNNQKGFTLIELIVVIVILGILSAVAVPKFVDMQGEAQRSAIDGALGSVRSAAALAHAQWLVQGQPATITAEGQTITMVNGYPSADDADDGSIEDMAGLDGFTIADDNGDPAEMTISNDGFSFTYTEAVANGVPTISDPAAL
ncbi:type II secretion system protein [Desulfuromonas acetoxidans]|uniref:Uncharacterized protein n=1 Tax=Desulfuromonas acetoxidans (strain DSM 684 / 11070) TaxID=281689 RepID=Q1K1Z5_DESA6|nr:type II secretion system protein [Desulfuromonas acetoxidans]EAT16644.1 conserved hypothetical protein [Desulfuromonas acetoxidans DSM 684]MBF0646481.1 type II secretion system protein [Desulfuromonas acetoxidans]NVD24755.1 type II secretion system protein [Desulfuromonas acetoxidans]NVE16800.1 type II secretion system protein [Desulfuromonas acetoxidans]